MSESVCYAAGGEGRTRDWLAQVHHMQLRNKINCLAGDFSGKTPALLCPESTTTLLPCSLHQVSSGSSPPVAVPFGSPAHEGESCQDGKAGEGLVCICRALISPALHSLDLL